MDFEEFLHRGIEIMETHERQMRPMRVAELRGRLSRVIEESLEDVNADLFTIPLCGTIELRGGKKLRFEIKPKVQS